MTLHQIARPSPLVHYDRPGFVADEIVRIMGFPAAEWTSRATARGDARLRSETLVHLARLASAQGQRTVFGQLMFAIGLRTANTIKRYARGFDVATTEEIAGEVDVQVVQLIMAEAACSASDFLEVAFEVAVRNRTLDAVRRTRRRIRTVALELDADDDRPTACTHEPASEEPTAEERLLARERHAKGRRLLRAIQNPLHREAYILHHFLGWPEYSADPAVSSLSRRFAKSDRQIRNWLKTAEADMRAASRGDQP